MHGVSKGRRFAVRVIAKGAIGDCVESAGSNVLLELCIPTSPVEFQKPCSKLSEFILRKCLDLFFENLDPAQRRASSGSWLVQDYLRDPVLVQLEPSSAEIAGYRRASRTAPADTADSTTSAQNS